MTNEAETGSHNTAARAFALQGFERKVTPPHAHSANC
jgi:hypothetical protein